VCDPLGLLGDTSPLEKAIRALERDHEYPGCGGYEMGVVVVDSIRSGNTQGFAKSVMDSWGVGKAACSNGVLLAMAIEDRQLFIATGRGAKENIPDNELEAVVDRMKPVMKSGNYAGAAEQCVSDVSRILSGESFAPSSWPALLMFCGFGVFAVASTLRTNRRQRGYDKCKRKLMEIERDRSQARANQYQQTSCPICLESFQDTAQLQVEMLVCGHKFHKDCISSWEDRSGTCPVCRQSTTDPVGANSSAFPASQGVARHSRPARASFDDEYRFRLGRARHYYPGYVSEPMLARWSSPDYCGSIVADTTFIRSSPSYTAPGSSDGGRGGGSSFGVGSSGGGGGAGGGW